MRTWLPLSLVTLAACGGGGGGGGSGGVSLDDLGSTYAAAYCQKAEECCTADELHDLTFVDTEAQCELFIGGLFDQYLVPALRDGEDAGRLDYDGDAMGACVDAVADLTCDQFAAYIHADGAFNACDNPFTPHVDDGGECGSDSDCVSGWCDGDSFDTSGNLSYGMCATRPGVGDPCPSFECAEGAYCSGGTCVETLPGGSDCASGDECQSGTCDVTCGAEMRCDGV